MSVPHCFFQSVVGGYRLYMSLYCGWIKTMFKNDTADYIFSYVWSSIFENLFFTGNAHGLWQKGIESLIFASLWIELQFKLVKKTILVMKSFVGELISRGLWLMHILQKIFSILITAWNLSWNMRIKASSEGDTLWHHFCMTNFDSSDLSESKHSWSQKSPKALISNGIRPSHHWEVATSSSFRLEKNKTEAETC